MKITEKENMLLRRALDQASSPNEAEVAMAAFARSLRKRGVNGYDFVSPDREPRPADTPPPPKAQPPPPQPEPAPSPKPQRRSQPTTLGFRVFWCGIISIGLFLFTIATAHHKAWSPTDEGATKVQQPPNQPYGAIGSMTNPAQPKNPTEYNNLPFDSIFIDLDGIKKRKKKPAEVK